MTAKFEVILTDFKTRNEKIIDALRKFNTKNLDAGIEKFNKGVDEFSKSVESFHREMSQDKRPDPAGRIWGTKPRKKPKYDQTTIFWGPPKRFSL